MDTASILLLATTVCANFGWQPAKESPAKGGEAGYEYLVQLDPETLDLLQSGQSVPIESYVPDHVRPIRKIRIVIGKANMPRTPLARDAGATAGLSSSDTGKGTQREPLIVRGQNDPPKRHVAMQPGSRYNYNAGGSRPQDLPNRLQGALSETGSTLRSGIEKGIEEAGEQVQGMGRNLQNFVRQPAGSLGQGLQNSTRQLYDGARSGLQQAGEMFGANSGSHAGHDHAGHDHGTQDPPATNQWKGNATQQPALEPEVGNQGWAGFNNGNNLQTDRDTTGQSRADNRLGPELPRTISTPPLGQAQDNNRGWGNWPKNNHSPTTNPATNATNSQGPAWSEESSHDSHAHAPSTQSSGDSGLVPVQQRGQQRGFAGQPRVEAEPAASGAAGGTGWSDLRAPENKDNRWPEKNPQRDWNREFVSNQNEPVRPLDNWGNANPANPANDWSNPPAASPGYAPRREEQPPSYGGSQLAGNQGNQFRQQGRQANPLMVQGRWLPLLLVSVGLVGSLSANFFLGWSYIDARQRYRSAVRKAARAFRRD